MRKRINTTIPAIQGRIGDIAYSEEITIIINGVYKDYLFKDDKFEGTISLSNYDFTKQTPILPITCVDGYDNLGYGNSTTYLKPLGFIFCKPNLSQLLILVKEPIGNMESGWSSQGGLYISAPAQTLDQSLQIAELLFAESDRYTNITWR